MKFTTQFLTVLAATAALAIPVEEEYKEIHNKFDLVYKDCVDIEKDNVFDEARCDIIESELCQKFYKTSLADLYADIPECKNQINKIDPTILKEREMQKLHINSVAIYKCAKDEQGNFCSYTPSNLQKVYNIKAMSKKEQNAILEQSIHDSCKSKKCVDEFLGIYNEINFDPSKLSEREKGYVSYLKSETCTAQNVQTNGNTDGKTNDTNGNADGKTDASNGKTNGNNNGKADATSGATQATYSSVLFIGLTVLLSALF